MRFFVCFGLSGYSCSFVDGLFWEFYGLRCDDDSILLGIYLFSSVSRSFYGIHY